MEERIHTHTHENPSITRKREALKGKLKWHLQILLAFGRAKEILYEIGLPPPLLSPSLPPSLYLSLSHFLSPSVLARCRTDQMKVTPSSLMAYILMPELIA